jgi:hypothetical protein
MVTSAPYGTAFIAPTVTRDGTQWSFLLHEKREIIQSVNRSAEATASEADDPEVRCMVVTVSSKGVGISILGLLLRFKSTPPVAYSLFMNPSDPDIRELLDDVMKQEKLVIDFFDERHVSRIVQDNALGECIRETVTSLRDISTAREVAFELALEHLLSEHADPASLWELLDACSAAEDELRD